MTLEIALKKLKKENVQTKYIHIVRGENSAYSVVLNYKGEKTVLTAHVHHPYHLPKPMPKVKWIYVSEMGSGYEKIFQEIISFSRANGVNIAFNPGTIQINAKKKFFFHLLKHTDLLFVNKEEAGVITKSSSMEIHHLAKELFDLGANNIIITDGMNGSYGFDGKTLHACPIFPAKRLEATGAGDAFATGYMGALMNGKSHVEALRWGSVNAASVVEFVGPQAGLLSDKHILARLKKNPRFKTKPL